LTHLSREYTGITCLSPRSAAEKRKFTAEARRRGLTLSEFLRQAGQTETRRADWKGFFAAMPAVKLPPHAAADLSTREGFGN
jgi:D-alanyl-D-alanine dipeptidase